MRTSLAALFCASTFAAGCSMSDAGITAAVKSKLAADETVSAFDVDVDTRYHVVTLAGRVDSVGEHDRAIRIARDTRGVRNIVDRLRISEAAATSGTNDRDDRPVGTSALRELPPDIDVALRSKVKASLLGDDRLASMKIGVRINDGIVMLNGNVPSSHDAARAVSLAGGVKGVRKVVDNLHVRSQSPVASSP